jgi:elongation factor Ts
MEVNNLMAVTAKMVSELRTRTGAGIMDCKKALIESNGDLEAAIQHLREKGLKASELKDGRAASEGQIVSYIHPGNRIGSLVEVNCETDFVARTKQFQILTKEIAMQVAAAKPRYLVKEDVPEEVLKSEREILRKQTLDEGKPDHIVDKIVEGRLSKFYSEACLLEQSYIREADKTVKQLIQEAIVQLGENIVVRRFSLYVLGQSE